MEGKQRRKKERGEQEERGEEDVKAREDRRESGGNGGREKE